MLQLQSVAARPRRHLPEHVRQACVGGSWRNKISLLLFPIVGGGVRGGAARYGCGLVCGCIARQSCRRRGRGGWRGCVAGGVGRGAANVVVGAGRSGLTWRERMPTCARMRHTCTHTRRRADATSHAVVCSETTSWGLTCEAAAEDLRHIAGTCCRCAWGHARGV